MWHPAHHSPALMHRGLVTCRNYSRHVVLHVPGMLFWFSYKAAVWRSTVATQGAHCLCLLPYTLRVWWCAGAKQCLHHRAFRQGATCQLGHALTIFAPCCTFLTISSFNMLLPICLQFSRIAHSGCNFINCIAGERGMTCSMLTAPALAALHRFLALKTWWTDQ